MTTATYRGVKYNTASPQEEHKAWIKQVLSSPVRLTYRGKRYEPQGKA